MINTDLNKDQNYNLKEEINYLFMGRFVRFVILYLYLLNIIGR